DSFTAALGGLLFGYEIGIINSVLEMDAFSLFFGMHEMTPAGAFEKTAESTFRKSSIVTAFVFGCIPGALIITFFGDWLGRKRAIMTGTFMFTAGGLIQALVPASSSVTGRLTTIVAGRFLGGCGIGMLSGSVPLYIAEIAPNEQRGRLTSVQQLMIT
ncbi:general substrate transporter, partial [Catenaria anguillulae PL171]